MEPRLESELLLGLGFVPILSPKWIVTQTPYSLCFCTRAHCLRQNSKFIKSLQ